MYTNIDLASSITALPKVGPRTKNRLEKLEIKTIEDLLYHFPFRYEDYSIVKKISDVREGEIITVRGVLNKVDNIFTKYGKKITKGVVQDETGFVNLVWFNQHYIKKSLLTGEIYNISGKVGKFNGKLTFTAPELELFNNSPINTSRLVPVYPETAGLSSKWIRKTIKNVLSSNIDLEEFIPDSLLEKYSLQKFNPALKNIHFPQTQSLIDKARDRFAFEELFIEMLKVEKRHQEWSKDIKGVELKTFKNKLDNFISNLEFNLTESQINSINEIAHELSLKHPSNRLLEGDVGTGKTIVAVAASLISFLNGYKTLYMAPTEILANQHFETFQKFLRDFNPNIKLKTSVTRKTDINDADIIVGTHALLFMKEPLDNVGLVIIDEQHRFGVEQRTKIRNLNSNNETPNLLTMTATPIPRTLALTLFGDLSISKLEQIPTKKKNIFTRVIPENKRAEAYSWIKKKNKPTFIVCPLIESSESESMENVKAAEEEFEELKKGIFSDKKIGLLHGRMKSKDKQLIVDEFKKGNIEILVSTPVIEVGIDIPEATIIVIESAERYGLASLHQLRGRVGRGGEEAFCMLFMSKPTRKAYARLKNLEKTLDGMELAEIDLNIRGQGDLFGTMQSGFKNLKVADLHDIELLEKAKIAAQEYFPKLEKFESLKQKLDRIDNYNVGNN